MLLLWLDLVETHPAGGRLEVAFFRFPQEGRVGLLLGQPGHRRGGDATAEFNVTVADLDKVSDFDRARGFVNFHDGGRDHFARRNLITLLGFIDADFEGLRCCLLHLEVGGSWATQQP